MCRPLRDGGKRCAAHQPATLGTKRFVKEVFDLNDTQINHTFRTLREQYRGASEPTVEEYQHVMDRISAQTERNLPDTAARRTILRRLRKRLDEEGLPDGATFQAIKKMVPRSRDQARDFKHAVRDYCRANGVTRAEAYSRFQNLYEDSNDAYANRYEDSLDGKTRYVLDQMNNDAPNRDVISETPRIANFETNANETSFGYDPDDGRLEVQTVMGLDYSFRNVPQDALNDLRNPDTDLAMVRTLQDNPTFHYDSTAEAARDAYGRYCRDCHQYRAASGHICEPPEPNEAVVSGAEDDEPAVQERTVSSEDPEERYAAASARVMEQLAARTADGNSAPMRPRQRMSARRRLWVAPLDSREVVEMGEDSAERFSGAGGLRFSAPAPAEVRDMARQGKVVQGTLVRHGNSRSYARDYNTSADVNMSWDMRYYCDDATGDVKVERVGTPRCDCQEYAQNSTCRHVRSQGNPQAVNGYLERDMKTYMRQVDPLSAARQQALQGQYLAISPNMSNARNHGITGTDDEGVGVSIRYATGASRIRHARQILADGGEVNIMNENSGSVSVLPQNDRRANVSGDLTLVGNSEDFGYEVRQSLYCNVCHRNDCSHITGLVNTVNKEFLPENAHTENVDPLSALNRINEGDWQTNAEDVKEMRQSFSVDPSYANDIDGYIEDYREARARVNTGESPLPYTYDNPTNGVCAPGGKAFGVEIEFDFPRQRMDYNAIDNIARDLHAEGLIPAPRMERWHYNARVANPYTSWTLESDSTVAAEIVSPILHDTPETWEQLEKICTIVKRHGGVASARCGQHVHMGTVDVSRRESSAQKAAKNAKILQVYAANEDSIRRIQTDPDRKRHRNTQYCSPLRQDLIQNSLYQFERGSSQLYNDHDSSVNFGYDGRIEFRGADGSLDPAHIQAQVMTTAGVVSAAERGEISAGRNHENLKHQSVGTNARRIAAIRAEEGGEWTDDELVIGDYSYRNFISQIFSHDHGKKMMVGIAANTPWQ